MAEMLQEEYENGHHWWKRFRRKHENGYHWKNASGGNMKLDIIGGNASEI
jgi:hypothetical protein